MKSAKLAVHLIITFVITFAVINLLSILASSQALPNATPVTKSQGDPSIQAELDKVIHVKRVQVGDSVAAHLTAPVKLADGTEIPKGSKLVGSITEIKVKADKQGPSKLGLLFTGVVAKNGTEIPIKGALVSVAPHFRQGEADLLSAGNPQSSGGRMISGTGANTLNNASNEGEALSRGLGARAPTRNVGESEMKPGNSYVPDLVLVSYSAGSPGTILASTAGSVYLDAGSRLLVLVVPR